MAVQHQSSSYSPVVFDQFLRRHSNQAFFGQLIGETAYSVIVLTLIPAGRTELSGTFTLAGIVVTLVLLLAFIYNTVDQMRPSAIVWMIQQVALRARERQQSLLARCRTIPQLTDTPGLPVRSNIAGYIVHINANRLARALASVPEETDTEIDFEMVVGDHVVPGAVICHIRGGDPETRDDLAGAVGAALTLGRMPDIDQDAAHGVDQLGNIAWAAGATNDPEGARVAIRTLHSLLDQLVTRILDSLTSVVSASGLSKQHQSCGYALEGLAEVLPRLDPDDQYAGVDRLHRALPLAKGQLYTREIEDAFSKVHDTLGAIGLAEDRDRVAEMKEQLARQHRLSQPGTDGATPAGSPGTHG